MKKRIYFLWIALAIVFTNCKSPIDNVKVKEQIYFFELIDSVRTDQSKNVIVEVYSKLQNKEFVLSLEDNDWQGIISYNNEVNLSDLSKYYPEIHKFKSLNKDSNVQEYNVKIELIYNKKLPDGIPNFNIKMYNQSADNKSWQQFANPGNFRFNTDFYNQNEQAEWIKRTIVQLTFK